MSVPLYLPEALMHYVRRVAKSQASAAVMIALAVTLPACGQISPATIVKLQVSETGTYELDGKVVEPAALLSTLRAAKIAHKELVVHVVPAANAKYAAVEFAVAAVQQVGARAGLVGNERF